MEGGTIISSSKVVNNTLLTSPSDPTSRVHHNWSHDHQMPKGLCTNSRKNE